MGFLTFCEVLDLTATLTRSIIVYSLSTVSPEILCFFCRSVVGRLLGEPLVSPAWWYFRGGRNFSPPTWTQARDQLLSEGSQPTGGEASL